MEIIINCPHCNKMIENLSKEDLTQKLTQNGKLKQTNFIKQNCPHCNKKFKFRGIYNLILVDVKYKKSKFTKEEKKQFLIDKEEKKKEKLLKKENKRFLKELRKNTIQNRKEMKKAFSEGRKRAIEEYKNSDKNIKIKKYIEIFLKNKNIEKPGRFKKMFEEALKTNNLNPTPIQNPLSINSNSIKIIEEKDFFKASLSEISYFILKQREITKFFLEEDITNEIFQEFKIKSQRYSNSPLKNNEKIKDYVYKYLIVDKKRFKEIQKIQNNKFIDGVEVL